jgi:hypothetical protein
MIKHCSPLISLTKRLRSLRVVSKHSLSSALPFRKIEKNAPSLLLGLEIFKLRLYHDRRLEKFLVMTTKNFWVSSLLIAQRNSFKKNS